MSTTKRFAAPLLAVLMFSLTGAAAFAQYGPPPPPAAYGWDAPPGELREVSRQGFRDGVEGARRDVENHRRPNVRNRDEYRHPNVPGNLRHDYRDGFRRGYDVAMQHLYYGVGPRPY